MNEEDVQRLQRQASGLHFRREGNTVYFYGYGRDTWHAFLGDIPLAEFIASSPENILTLIADMERTRGLAQAASAYCESVAAAVKEDTSENRLKNRLAWESLQEAHTLWGQSAKT